MIAKYVLFVPGGLYWKWRTYRKASEVATLCEPSWYFEDLDIFNALTRTCRTVYNELQGMILTLNTYHFSWSVLCTDITPSAWFHVPAGRSAEVEHVLEAFDNFQGFLHQRPISITFHFDLFPCDNITVYLKRFEQLSSDRSGLSLTVVYNCWTLNLRTDDCVDAMIERLEADADLSDEEFRRTVDIAVIRQDIVISRIHEFLAWGAQLRGMLEKAGATRANRSWPLLPNLEGSKTSDVASHKALLTPEEQHQLDPFFPGRL